jgi:HSP20 family protein
MPLSDPDQLIVPIVECPEIRFAPPLEVVEPGPRSADRPINTGGLSMYGSLFDSFESGLLGELRRLDSEMDQILSRGRGPAGIRTVRRGTFPPINIGASPDRVDVYLFAAGLDARDLEISIQQNLLVVSGQRKPERREVDYYRRERFEGEFRRVITLPDDVDPERVEAKYRDGVLHITVQRSESARPRQIAVQ